MPRYLVTGGAGFIGSHITSRLVSDGHDVTVLDDLSAGTLDNLAHIEGRFRFIQGDVANPWDASQAVDGIDIVFHQAALASVPRSVEAPRDSHTACATGTLTLLDACRRAGVRRVVYAGSSSAYGNSPVMPKREDFLPEVLSPYAAAKLAGELYCETFARTYDIETVRLRYFNVFGPRQDPNSPYSAVIPLFVMAMLEGRRPVIYGDGTQSRDFTYVENVVEANLLAASATGVSGKVFNAACGTSYSLLTLIDELRTLLDCDCDPDFQPERAGDVKHSWADIGAAQRELGYSVRVPFEEGLKQTIDYYKSLARNLVSS